MGEYMAETPEKSAKTLIKRIREALGMTQPDLARVLGKSMGALRKYEAGRKLPPQVSGHLMSLCVGRGRVDLADEIEDAAVGHNSYTNWAHSSETDPLHGLLDKILANGDQKTIQQVARYLEMVIFWLSSARAREIKQQLTALHPPAE